MSINRSEVRKSALSLLYALSENGGSADTLDMELFWNIAQEKKTDHFNEAHAKTALHICRASADSARLLSERSTALLDAMHGDLTTASLRDEIERFAGQSAAFESALAALSYSLRDKRREGTAQLALCTRDLLRLAASLSAMGAELQPRLADFPVYSAATAPMSAAIRRRCRLTDEVATLSEPEKLSESKEHSGLARQALDLQELRPAVEGLVDAVLQHREALEAELSQLIAHYSLERLDTVDTCILLLALYELRFNKLETAIVISEANLLANAYSGSKSAPFIHGILAAAAKA